MERKIITTQDGSTTIQLVDWNECYHSTKGAIQEAYHVFIQNGFNRIEKETFSILEIGFGTGLNALITLLEAQRTEKVVSYTGIEAFPISEEEVLLMNYPEQLNAVAFQETFQEMHRLDWGLDKSFGSYFSLTKKKQFFNEISENGCHDLIYFDAFGYQVQPELWTAEIFKKMYTSLQEKGVLVTYAARGVIKRAMQEAGFEVVKVPGPPGKREMMIAFKNFMK